MKNIIFVHCPKTAGCAVSLAIGGCHSRKKNPLVKDGHLALSRYTNLQDSFVFSIARNPWDRLVSCYRFSNIRKEGSPKEYWLQKHGTFSEFIFYLAQIENDFGLGGEKAFEDEPHKLKMSLEKCHLRNIVDCISLNRKVRANFICEFSTLEEDWNVLSTTIGIDQALQKVNCAPEKKDYREFYTDELAEIVKKLYKPDIDYFGYSFDKPGHCCFDRLPK